MSYYVRVYGKTWVVAERVWKNGQDIRRVIPQKAYQLLGFSPDMTVDEAKERCKRLNFEKQLEKKRAIDSIRNHEEISLKNSIYLPETITSQFKDWLEKNLISGRKTGIKFIRHWSRVKKVIRELELLPRDYASNKGQILNYIKDYGYSPYYAKCLIRMLNLYGEFYSEKQGQFFKPISHLTISEAQQIRDIYMESDTYIGPSEPLTPEILEQIKSKISESQYRWLALTVWFGLRPEEVNSLQKPKFKARVEYDARIKKDVLWVYQSKLQSIPREKRWKGIPIFLPQQKSAVRYIEMELDQPLAKTIKKYTGRQITLYGGRKGFTDLMLKQGQKLENISQWLGHQSIDRTWRDYKQKQAVYFD